MCLLCYCVIIGLEMFVFMNLSDFFYWAGGFCCVIVSFSIGLQMFVVFIKLSDLKKKLCRRCLLCL